MIFISPCIIEFKRIFYYTHSWLAYYLIKMSEVQTHL